MTKIIFLLYFFCFCALSLSQTVPHPLFFHEQLTLGTHFRTVMNKVVATKETLQWQSPHQFLKMDPSTFFSIYFDTMFDKHVGITLEFSKRDSLLSTITVIFQGVDPKTGKPLPDADQSIDALWDSLSFRWGSPSLDKSVPFVVSKREWLFSSTVVQMLRLKTTPILTVTYTSRE